VKEDGLAVDSLQISAQAATPEGRRRGGGRPFRKGQSGNPAGRKPGSKNKSTLAAQVLLEGEAEALTRKAVELAKAGNALALKLCLDRVYAPRRERAVSFALPPIASAEDLAAAMAAISAATAKGDLTPGEAFDLARVAESFLRVIDARNEELRRKQWAAREAQRATAPSEPSFAARMDAWIKSGKGA
jgi:hypothetical protein